MSRADPEFEIMPWLDVGALGAMWRDLQARAEHSFFLDWSWIGAWLAETPLPPAVLVGRDGGRVVLLGVLMPCSRRDGLPMPVHGLRLHDTGNDAMDVITIEYNGFLVDRARAGPAEAAAIRFLLDGRRILGERRDELHLRGMPAPSGAAPFDLSLLGGGLVAELETRQPTWQAGLGALRRAGGDYVASLGPNTRHQIRRSLRLYAERGEVVAERAGSVEEATAWLDALSVLHQRYWTGRGEQGAFALPYFGRFQRRLIAGGLPRGQVELFRVRAGAHEVGYLYNFVDRGRVLAYQSGFNYEPDPRLKPGLVCHALCIGRHLAEGAETYDFLAGEARYKANLGSPGPEMDYWRIERPTLALGLETAVRGWMRRLAAAG